ncbi:hypothetical protein WA158_004671 [Blastocystis sp. Blastoise]
MNSVSTRNVITLKGSAEMVAKFFKYAVTSIIYQRDIYPPESFRRVQAYGLAMVEANDKELQSYIDDIVSQVKYWLEHGDLQSLILVIHGCESNTILERWAFTVETDEEIKANPEGVQREKSLDLIQKEIQAIIRQITASVTFLPLLQEPCRFELIVYTDTNADVPSTWEHSDPKLISNSTEVRLRSFSTTVHTVGSAVSYKRNF